MKVLRALLGLVPFVGILAGVFFVNRVTPFVLGLPFLLFWVAAWAIFAALAMALVYLLDPRTRKPWRSR